MIGGFRSPHIKLSGELFHGGTSVLVLSSCVVFLSRGYPHFKISDAIIPVDVSIVNVITRVVHLMGVFRSGSGCLIQ